MTDRDDLASLRGDLEVARLRLEAAHAEIARLRLTAAEREAVERAVETLDGWQKTGGYHSAIEDDAATLRGLLERMPTNHDAGRRRQP